MRFTIAEMIAARCFGHPDRVAMQVLDGRPPLLYRDAWRRIVALANAMDTATPGRHGRMVGLMLPNEADAPLAFAACQWARVVAVPLNARLADREIEYILRDADVRLVIGGGALAPRAAAIAGRLGIDCIDAGTIPTPADAPRPELGSRDAGEEWAAIAYTSGTTGFPKGAIYSNDYFTMNNLRWGWEFGMSGDHLVLIAGPMFHMSYAGFALAGLMIGAQVRVMPEFSAALALEELGAHSTFAFLVPSMLAMMAAEWQRTGARSLAAARMILSAGAPWPASLVETTMRMFPNARLAEMYGWTEGTFVTFEFKDPERLVPQCVGWPALGADVALFRPDGEPCAAGEYGEIGVRSAVRFPGYLGNPEATAAAWHRGYLLSGDIGAIRPDGRLCLVDRKKDLIITGGENVYPAEVERVLLEHPQVSEAVVVGLPDAAWGERIAALVVPREGAQIDAAVLERFCRDRLAGYKVPRVVEFVRELPRTALGKVQRFRAVEQFSRMAERQDD